MSGDSLLNNANHKCTVTEVRTRSGQPGRLWCGYTTMVVILVDIVVFVWPASAGDVASDYDT